jgi:hypothetical protein
MHGKTLYTITQEIIEDTEDFLFSPKIKNKVGRWFHRHLLSPLKLLCLGTEEVFKPFFKWMLMAFPLLFIGTIILKEAGMPTEQMQTTIVFLIYSPIILVMFAAPSTYTFSDLKSHHIIGISRIILNKGFDSKEKIELFENNLEIIEHRTSDRVRSFKLLIGACWALAMFLLTQFNNFVLKSTSTDINKILQDNIHYLFIAMLITLLSLWITTSYKMATDTIFKSIKYSISEIKLSLIETCIEREKNSQEQAPV